MSKSVVIRARARNHRGARNVRLFGESRRKDDRLDAQALARLARIDPRLLSPIQHRSAQAQADLSVIAIDMAWCARGQR